MQTAAWFWHYKALKYIIWSYHKNGIQASKEDSVTVTKRLTKACKNDILKDGETHAKTIENMIGKEKYAE